VRLLRQLHGATGLFASQFALANRFVHRIGRQLIRLASYRQALRRLFASQIRLGVRKHGSRLSVYRQLLRPLRGLASLLHGLLGRFSRFKSIAALDFRDGQRPLGQLARFVGQRPRLLRRQARPVRPVSGLLRRLQRVLHIRVVVSHLGDGQATLGDLPRFVGQRPRLLRRQASPVRPLAGLLSLRQRQRRVFARRRANRFHNGFNALLGQQALRRRLVDAHRH